MERNPASNRDLLLERFGVPLPTRPERRKRVVTGKVVSGSVAPQGPMVLPASHRKDPHAETEVTEEDLRRHGMYALVKAGFVPPDADLTSALLEQQGSAGPLRSSKARIHSANSTARMLSTSAAIQPLSFSGSVKLDLATPVIKSHHWQSTATPLPQTNVKGIVLDLHVPTASADDPSLSQRDSGDDGQIHPDAQQLGDQQLEAAGAGASASDNNNGSSGNNNSSGNTAATAGAATSSSAQPVQPPARSYDELMDQFSLHHFIIRHGKSITQTPEFDSFKRKNSAIWGEVLTLIRHLEEVLTNYAIPFAFVDGQKLALLASRNSLTKPPMSDLLACLLNGDAVIPVVRKPGQRFRGKDGARVAVTKIQALVRMFLMKRKFHLQRIGLRSVLLIQSQWRTWRAHRAFLAKMAELQVAREQAWGKAQAEFRERWPRISSGPRVVIHLNSLPWDAQLRRTMKDFVVRENGQMSRLCDIADPDVEVVYVSPFPLSEDLLHYYNKMLTVGGIAVPQSRYRIVHPENWEVFPRHMTLTQLVLYSPRCLRKIKNICRGKVAYLAPGIVGRDEFLLSLELGVPCLGPDPKVADLYGTKSGAKAIFEAADVATAPGVRSDLFSPVAVYRALSKTIAANFDYPRWIFKIDDEVSGRGHAFLDVASLKSYATLGEEKATNANIWNHPSVLDAVNRQLYEDLVVTLPESVQFAHPRLFKTWHQYESAFTRIGGVIEACPPVITGSPYVNLDIDPSGRVSIVSTHDLFFSHPYTSAGSVFPAASAPYPALRDASLAIARQLVQRGVMGPVGISFVTFKATDGSTRIWACDLDIRLSDSAASFKLFRFLTFGAFDQATGSYLVPIGEDPSAPRTAPRFYAIADFLHQPNLATIQYNVFFGLCRQQGITFDLHDKVGTVFNIVDTLSRGYLGVSSAGATAKDALRDLVGALAFILNQCQDGDQAAKETRITAKNFQKILNVTRAMLAQEDNNERSKANA